MHEKQRARGGRSASGTDAVSFPYVATPPSSHHSPLYLLFLRLLLFSTPFFVGRLMFKEMYEWGGVGGWGGDCMYLCTCSESKYSFFLKG